MNDKTIAFIPITRENIYTLKSGDWIWDDKPIERREHAYSLRPETVTEPIGFRQIHILDLRDFAAGWKTKPFMLSDIDSDHYGYRWVYFEENRFYMCKSDSEE
jgi:hypothetical protein